MKRCMQVSVAADRQPDRILRGWMYSDDGKLLTPREVRDLCRYYRAKGFDVIPCRHVDEETSTDGRCPGYEPESKAADAS